MNKPRADHAPGVLPRGTARTPELNGDRCSRCADPELVVTEPVSLCGRCYIPPGPAPGSRRLTREQRQAIMATKGTSSRTSGPVRKVSVPPGVAGYLTGYKGASSFVNSVKRQFAKGGTLSQKQIAAIEKIMGRG